MVLWWPCTTLRVQHASQGILVLLCDKYYYLTCAFSIGDGDLGIAMPYTAPMPQPFDYALAAGLAGHLLHSCLAYQTTLRKPKE